MELKFTRLFHLLFVLCPVIFNFVSSSSLLQDEKYGIHWQNMGQSQLKKSLKMTLNTNVAKNIIFFLGDGMGVPTVTAMRIFKGQKLGKRGEEEMLAFDSFPHTALVKTYALDRQNPDSAATATAYLCGVKANYETLGVDGRVQVDDCEASLDESTHVTSILQWAQEAGKATGLVTTTRVTHASPAGLYAHCPNRFWEGSTPDNRCKDIAKQLVKDRPGKDINVILGGGRAKFLPSHIPDTENIKGNRSDGANLIEEWLQDKAAKDASATAVFDYKGLINVDTAKTDYLLGLFNTSHLPFVADRVEIPTKVPTLVDLTDIAIKILKKNENGFFLFVEGGKIDLAHHRNWARKALEEGVEFDQAIQLAVNQTDKDDTLIVVTADHSHTMSIGGGYPDRGNDILGIAAVSDVDNLTITTIAYANGPGYRFTRENITREEILDRNYQQNVAYPAMMETHGSEDVSVHARGPMAHLFHGVQEQSYIPYAMGYAACIGPDKSHCTGAASRSSGTFKWFVMSIAVIMYHSLPFCLS